MRGLMHALSSAMHLEKGNRQSMLMHLKDCFSLASLVRGLQVEQQCCQFLPLILWYKATAAAALPTPHRSRVSPSLSLSPTLQRRHLGHPMSLTLTTRVWKGGTYRVRLLHKPGKSHLCPGQDMARNLRRPISLLHRLSRVSG
jgi:hypothetical protein